MDHSLFERATGALGPNVFARLETTRLMRSFRPAPQFRFDGGHKGTVTDGFGGTSEAYALGVDGPKEQDVWAHQAGVNALALERFDGRMYETVSLVLKISFDA